MPKHRDLNIDNPLKAEKDAMKEAVAITHDEAEADLEEAVLFEKGARANEAVPAELAAIHTDNASALELDSEVPTDNVEKEPAAQDTKKAKSSRRSDDVGIPTKASGKKAKATISKPKQRSVAYQAKAATLDRNRRYKPEEAFRLAKEASYTKFDGAMEIHVRLSPARGKKKDDGDRFRTIIALPHGTGKEPSIGILDETMIAEIKQKGDTKYAILLATPAMMPKVAGIAKILGPKGKMPNPKTGTVAEDLDAAKRAILSGRVEVRGDSEANVHQALGRVSWPVEKLIENYRAFVAVLPMGRLQSMSVSATMSPSLHIDWNL